MKYKTWRIAKEFIEKRERKAFLREYGFDNKCPLCDTWQGNVGGVIGNQPDYPDADHEAYRCGNCKQWFIMDMRGMIAVNAEDQRPADILNHNERERERNV